MTIVHRKLIIVCVCVTLSLLLRFNMYIGSDIVSHHFVDQK